MYQQINLYQPIFRKQRQIFSALALLYGLAAVAVTLLGLYAFGWSQVSDLESELMQLEGHEKALTTQLARIDPSLNAQRRSEVHDEVEHLNATLIEQQRLIDVLRERPLGKSDGFSAYLAAIGRQRTPELWLTSLAVNGGTGAIDLAGRSLRPELVPEFLQRLGRENELTAQRFDRLEIERDDATGQTEFRATSRAAALSVAEADERRRR